MAAATSPSASPVAVGVLIHPEDKQLKTVAHSLLESKLEKMLSSAAPPGDPHRTKRHAIDWIRQWDLDGDGLISELELKGAAMQHAKLQMSYNHRGGWLVFLVILAICCFAVILGLSVWANDVSRESKGTSGQNDLGGFTMRAKDSHAVVKTGTALYEFRLPRIGYLPFDELSQITGIGFVYKRALQFMSVEGFQWYGSGNVTFFSPRGTTFSISWPNENQLIMALQEQGEAAPAMVYQGPAPYAGNQRLVDNGLLSLQQSGHPVTVDNFYKYVWEPYLVLSLRNVLPGECAEIETVFKSETCMMAMMMQFQGFGVIEAAVGPQDYYGTQASEQEKELLTDYSMYKGAVFNPDLALFEQQWRKTIQARIDAMPMA